MSVLLTLISKFTTQNVTKNWTVPVNIGILFYISYLPTADQKR
jgi:hypothetical protein